MVVNSFSKSWAMTGWRMGWLHHPTGLPTKRSAIAGQHQRTSAFEEQPTSPYGTAKTPSPPWSSKAAPTAIASQPTAFLDAARHLQSTGSSVLLCLLQDRRYGEQPRLRERLATEFKAGVAQERHSAHRAKAGCALFRAIAGARIDEAMSRLERALRRHKVMHDPIYLQDEHVMLRATNSWRFFDEEVLPQGETWERDGMVPREIVQKMGEFGFRYIAIRKLTGMGTRT